MNTIFNLLFQISKLGFSNFALILLLLVGTGRTNYLAAAGSVRSEVVQTTVTRIGVTTITPSENTGMDYSPWLDDNLNNLVQSSWQSSNMKYVDVTLQLEGKGTVTKVSLYDHSGTFTTNPAEIYALNGTQRTYIGTFTGETYQAWIDISVTNIEADAIIVRKYGNNIPQKVKVFGTLAPTQIQSVITFAALPDKTVGDAAFTLSATSNNTQTPITFASSNPGVISVANINGTWQATVVGAGTATITASQAGNTNYLAATDVVWAQVVLVPLNRIGVTKVSPSENTGMDYSPWLDDNIYNLVQPSYLSSNMKYVDVTLPLERKATIARVSLYDLEGSFPTYPTVLYAVHGTQQTYLGIFTGESYQTWVNIEVSNVVADAIMVRKYGNYIPHKIKIFGTLAPAITTLSPTSGPSGSTVLINGTDFTGVTAVSFNGASAVFTVNSSTQISALVPAGASTGTVSVTAAGGSAVSPSDFTVIVPPVLSNFSPGYGLVGQAVTLNGSNFSSATAIKFNGTNATFTVVNDSQITAQVPPGATSGIISVNTPGGTGNSSSAFTVTSSTNSVPDNIEYQALVDLYNSTNGAGWTKKTNWLSGSTIADIATWQGVTVTNGDVTQLNMSSINMVGSIPASLGNLIKLTHLNFSANQLNGSIPASLGNLINLEELYLRTNSVLSGTIPTEFAKLKKIRLFFLNSTNINGSIPEGIGRLTNMTNMDLSNTQISGIIPDSLGQLSKLRILSLNFMKLSGPIPVTFGKLSSLQQLQMLSSGVSGAIPSSLGRLTGLIILDLTNNKLTGAIPDSIGHLINLEGLSLRINQLNGKIPTSFNNLIKLKQLFLNNNNLIGPVPVGIAGFPFLTTLQIENNFLTSIPNFSNSPNKVNLTIRLFNNLLDFHDLEPHFSGPGVTKGIKNFQFQNQKMLGVNNVNTVPYNLLTTVGQKLELQVSDTLATHNVYQWQKLINGTWQNIAGATLKKYIVNNVNINDAGDYLCKVTNTWATQTTISSYTVSLTVSPLVTFSPESGNPGTPVIITGTSFTGITSVLFNEIPATYTIQSSGQLTAIVPSGASTGKISVFKGTTIDKSPLNFIVLNTYTWNGSSIDWSDAASWTPARTNPSPTDILLFNGAITPVTVVNVNFSTNESISQLKFINNIAATFTVDAAKTIVVGHNGFGSDLTVALGCSLIVNKITTESALYITIPYGQTALLEGEVKL